MSYKTLEVQFKETICFVKFNRPEAKNTINDVLVDEFEQVLSICEEECSVLVLEGSKDIFCLGADFESMIDNRWQGSSMTNVPERLYNVWLKLATGSYISLAHVEGKANAGGLGFVAACDIVLAQNTATFSLSELLFGLFPACVLPFLIRKTGYQKAHYLTLMTKPFLAETACSYGLVDAYSDDSTVLLRKHLIRLKKLPKNGIKRYKKYLQGLDNFVTETRDYAINTNITIFSDPQIIEMITDYVINGKLPWENKA